MPLVMGTPVRSPSTPKLSLNFTPGDLPMMKPRVIGEPQSGQFRLVWLMGTVWTTPAHAARSVG